MYRFKKPAKLTHLAANNDEHRVMGLPFTNFKAFYQPIVELSSGKIAGYEALARQKGETGEYASAGALFVDPAIPRTEKLLLDRYLRKMALTDARQSSGNEFITLNISPDWVDLLNDDSLIPTLQMVEESGLDPSRIIVEITEHRGQLTNLKRLTEAYHRAGLKVAIDDFGAGASQLDRVVELKPDFIKLDMGLFKSAVGGGHAADVLLSMVAIAQRAGCKIICEGVETEEELHFAIECGADFIQGWLFDPALPKRIHPDSYLRCVNSMKSGFLKRKSLRLERSARHNRDVAETLMRVCQQINPEEPLTSIIEQLSMEQVSRLGLLQFFLCDQSGNQVSDNVVFVDGCIQLDDGFRGYNWSHRPYFPLLHAMARVQNDHIVVSNPYRDIKTGQLCKTHGIFISPERVLLIDVRVDDDILFQSPS